MEEKVLKGHGKTCEKCNGRIFIINATTVHEIIVDENGNILGEGKVINKPSLSSPFKKVKRCLSCGYLNNLVD